MWLIDTHTYKLVDVGSRLERYAILSHTWGREEVSFQEYHAGSATHTPGYQKIVATCHQAREDGYDYVWVDTCCIDKTSSAILSESINSMFKWYQDAAMCYAYLEDVQGHDDFHKSRWFTRGWTLQELLAPRNVEFYNAEWQHMGTKRDLARQIRRITGIDSRALHGIESLAYVRAASIAKKMSWAAGRKTTRDEDIAYSLLGIFDVNMPLLYGEGGVKAFHRLQEEIIKRNLDQTFLLWTTPSLEGTGDAGDFLASSPDRFARSDRISTTDENLAPFSLNNQGLQIRLPIFRLDGQRNMYVAILACVADHLTSRVGILLRAIDRSGKVFIRQVEKELRVVTEAEYLSASDRDCSLLRAPLSKSRRFLSVHVQHYPNFRQMDWWNVAYLATEQWHHVGTAVEKRYEIPTVGGEPFTYGVVFTESSEEEYSYGMNTVVDSALQRRRSVYKVTKVLVRVDIDANSPYSASVYIQRVQAVTRSRRYLEVIPTSKPPDISAGRCAKISIGPERVQWHPRESRSLPRPVQRALTLLPRRFLNILPLLLPLRDEPNTLTAKVFWQRKSGQDELVLECRTIQSSLWGRLLDSLSLKPIYLTYLFHLIPCYYATVRVSDIFDALSIEELLGISSHLGPYVDIGTTLVFYYRSTLAKKWDDNGFLQFILGRAFQRLFFPAEESWATWFFRTYSDGLLFYLPAKRTNPLRVLQLLVTVYCLNRVRDSLFGWMLCLSIAIARGLLWIHRHYGLKIEW